MKNIILLSFILIIPILLIQCDNNKNKKKRTNTNTNNVVLIENNYNFENPPPFRKDDELAFIDSETENIIFQIDAEIASNDIERARGLMYRNKMEENQGMFFLFEREQTQSFYMRNTLIPLDIIYINSKMKIVDIYKSTNPMDETSLPSAAPAQYVVEINGGLCEKYGIEIGDLIVY